MDLDSLPVEDGFRLRGEASSRLAAFVDAAFVFSMLVISVGTLPTDVPELYLALHRLPTFAAWILLILYASLGLTQTWHHGRFGARRRALVESGAVVRGGRVLARADVDGTREALHARRPSAGSARTKTAPPRPSCDRGGAELEERISPVPRGHVVRGDTCTTAGGPDLGDRLPPRSPLASAAGVGGKR